MLKITPKSAVLGLALLFTLAPAGFAQTELLTNPGFEKRNTSGWTTWGCTLVASSAATRTGTRGGLVSNRSAEWHSPTRELLSLLTPNQAYRISAWVRPAAGTNLEIYLNTKQTDANGDTYKTLDVRICPAGQWTQLTGSFAFNPVGTATAVTLYLHCAGNTNRNYDVDDWSLQVEPGMQVNLNLTNGPVSTVASGFLFGMTATEPAAQYFEAIIPKLVRFHGNVDGTIGWGFSSGTGFSSPAFMARLSNAGAQRQVVVSDEYMWHGYHTSWGWPGDAAHGGYGPYDLLDQMIDSLLASAAANGYTGIQWDLWNEPDYPYFWGASQAQFFATWKHMFDRIRAADTNAIIVGPSIATFVSNKEDGGWLKSFLLYAKTNNCLPNILSWHEMVWDKHLPRQAQWARNFMASNGIASRPIQINEYLNAGDDFTLSPGRTVTFLNGLEAAGVSGAAHAVWEEVPGDGSSNGLFDGRLGGIMTRNAPYQPRAPWHVYNSYTLMTGKRVSVTGGGIMRGLASVDATNGIARVLIGNESAQSFSTSLTITNLASVKTNGQVRLRVREIPFSSTNALAAPTELSNQVLNLGTTNRLIVSLSVSGRAAYEIILSKDVGNLTVLAQLSDLFDNEGTGPFGSWSYSLVGAGGTAFNLPDTGARLAWTVGWADSPWNYSANFSIMGGWVWPDGTVNHPPAAYGYSWNGTHDTGWAAYVGYAPQEIDVNKMRARSNGASDPLLIWVNTTGGALPVKFTYTLHTLAGTSYFGAWSTTINNWVGDASYAPHSGSGFSDATPRTITGTVTVNAGEALIFSYFSAYGDALIDQLKLEHNP